MAVSAAAPRHCLASGRLDRTKSVPNTGQYTGISHY
jgi:hypothetical protein